MKAHFCNLGHIVIQAENIAEVHAMRMMFPQGVHSTARLDCSSGLDATTDQTQVHFTIHVYPVVSPIDFKPPVPQ